MAGWFVFSGIVLFIGALIATMNVGNGASTSLGLGVATLGLALGGGLCYLAAALVREPAEPLPTRRGSRPDELTTEQP